MKKLILVLRILGAFAEDFFIGLGLTLIVVATFMIDRVAGIYSLGIVCLAMGLILARKPPRKE